MKQKDYIELIYHAILTASSSAVLRNKLLKISGEMIMAGAYSDLLIKAQEFIKMIESRPIPRNFPSQFKSAADAASIVWQNNTYTTALKEFRAYVEQLRNSTPQPVLSREQLMACDKEYLVDVIMSNRKGG